MIVSHLCDCISPVWLSRGRWKCKTRKWWTMKYWGGGMQDWNITDKSEGLENAGQENDEQKCKAGKCKTGKWRTKMHGWKIQDWKMTEIKSAEVSVIRRHVLVAWHDEMTPKQGTNTLMLCIWHCSHVRRVVPLWYCSRKRRHAALVLHGQCEHGFKVHRTVAITALSLHALHQ